MAVHIRKKYYLRIVLILVGNIYILYVLYIVFHCSNHKNIYDRQLRLSEKVNIFDNRNQILFSESKIMINFKDEQNFGEMGRPVLLSSNLTQEIKYIIETDRKRFGYSDFISNLIALDRKLPDYRDERCRKNHNQQYKDVDYDPLVSMLPSVSVVIVFHVESRSTLLRTVHSVLNRTPNHLLQEVILVDDGSPLQNLKQLDGYFKAKNITKVRIIRMEERVGVAAARKYASIKAIAKVLAFLNPCCECTEGWLEPLLKRLVIMKKMVVVPVIDRINCSTFEYKWKNFSEFSGFDWNLNYIWHQMSNKNDISPFITPVIWNGIFIIYRKFFFELNIYGTWILKNKVGLFNIGFLDKRMNDLSNSFQIWMCGGRIEVVPCSHIGCVFKDEESKDFYFNDDKEFIKTRNVRLAEVWMDDYKKYYYERMGNEIIIVGDIMSQIYRRDNLGCRSFKWYVNNIYPEIKPVESYYTGELRYLKHHSLCVDSPGGYDRFYKKVKLSSCQGKGENQFWIFSKGGKIMRDRACLDYESENVILSPCHDEETSQFWMYDSRNKKIKHERSQMCLKASDNFLSLDKCSVSDNQSWIFNRYNYTVVNSVMNMTRFKIINRLNKN